MLLKRYLTALKVLMIDANLFYFYDRDFLYYNNHKQGVHKRPAVKRFPTFTFAIKALCFAHGMQIKVARLGLVLTLTVFCLFGVCFVKINQNVCRNM